MIVDSQISTGLASAALAVSITQLLASNRMGPITGSQLTGTGAEILAKARDILAGPKGAALSSAQCSNFWQQLRAYAQTTSIPRSALLTLSSTGINAF